MFTDDGVCTRWYYALTGCAPPIGWHVLETNFQYYIRLLGPHRFNSYVDNDTNFKIDVGENQGRLFTGTSDDACPLHAHQ